MGHAVMRVGSGAGGVLVGLYLSDLANRGRNINAELVGALGAISFGAELVGALPMGMLADIIAPRAVMTAGGLIAAAGVYVMGMTTATPVFFVSRALEGLGAAAAVPSTLAYLADVTLGDRKLRGRVMSFFELTLLAGIALGSPIASALWQAFRRVGFTAAAAIYAASAILLTLGAIGSTKSTSARPIESLKRAFAERSVRRLAPAWISMNAIIGLWLGPTFIFLLTRRSGSEQLMAGLFADNPSEVGWVLLIYSIVFAAGVTAWSFVLHRVSRKQVLYISLSAMLVVCAGLYIFNHSQAWSPQARRLLLSAIAISIMVESGFTPAALALLADVVGGRAGRGSAMGIYSALLGIGALIGSGLAGAVGAKLSVDGLIYATLALALLSMMTVRQIPAQGEFADG
jgi:MFS family permease